MRKVLLLIAIVFCFGARGQITTILNFNGSNGNAPNGDLYFDGTYLYGMTQIGGTNSLGNIFKIKPDGTGLTILLNFNDSNGSNPMGGLISDGTYLYGMTEVGGQYSKGVLFKIMPDGSNYTKLIDFYGTNGSGPNCSLYYDSTYLYGVSPFGGGSQDGNIFKVKPDGTGFSNIFTFIGTNGAGPYGKLISDGTYLYGMTSAGGSNLNGVVYKIKPDGTGYQIIYNLGSSTNGQNPYGSLYYDGTYLYGMTNEGGATDNAGVLFKIKPNGLGHSIILNFNDTNGANPHGSLISDGTYLYGMTESGGTLGNGVIFKIKPDGSSYSKLIDFNGNNGANPYGSLISDGTYLYGVAENGGIVFGNVFKFCISSICGMGIEYVNNQTGNFILYPNPTNSIINVQLAATDELALEMQVTDILGNTVIKNSDIKTQNCKVDVSDLNSGVYFVRVGTTIQKFVKQ